MAKDVIGNITVEYNRKQKIHQQRLRLKRISKCNCKFEINFPISSCIQHSNFENCGWFALYFTQFNEARLIQWIKSKKGQYGQIKNNYDNMISYFRNTFFKDVTDYQTFNEYQINAEKKQCLFRQRCKNPRSCIFDS